MPNKPIKQGYKLFALAEHGYVWTFTWLSSSQAVPPTANPGADESLYNIYFDNYFSTVALFEALRNLRCVALHYP
ncbi:hypothetical protein N7461_003430 [Penicillium sp. DV-2018c]|nr:hypothetical protein N7461_003430 [Penicillium sp. DV-2018c]